MVDFLIIGAMKSGTTSLHRNLRLHPAIGISRLKEANYFSSNFVKGNSWYQKYLENGEKMGESSPSYAMRHLYPETASNIFSYNPNVKLIYILRDPVERIISHLHHDLYRDRFKIDQVNEVIRKDPDYINTSRYFWQLEAYLEYFRKENILLLDFKHLHQDLNKVLNQICEFIGLDEYDFSSESQKFYSTEKRYLIKQFDKAHRFNNKWFLKAYHTFFYFLNIKVQKPNLSPDSIKYIREQLDDDVNQLKSWSGMNFKWPYFPD